MSERTVVVKQQDEISICAEDGYVLLTQKDAYGEEQTIFFSFECAEKVSTVIFEFARKEWKGK